MASVYEATDVVLGRTVAVKLFRNDSLDGSGPERQSGEIALLASLNHFALVTLFDAGTADISGAQRTFIVMEFVDGSDLRSRMLAEPSLDPADIARMGADLAEALHYVHAKGIIHRDIKPANVLLGASGFPGRSMHAKLADFGIARLLDETRLTATGTLLGTASYLSPEQALGSRLGPPSDIYSLGLVLLECVSGERAYPGTAVESAMARLQRQPHVPATLGSDWVTLLTAMTSRAPEDRPTAADAADVLRGLEAPDTLARAVAATAPGAMPTVRLDQAATQALSAADLGDDAATRLLPVSPPTAATVLTPIATAAQAQAATPAQAAAVQPDAPRPTRPMLGTPRTATAPDEATTARRRKNAVIGSIVVALVMLGALVALFLATLTVEPTATPPNYPAVEGPLGSSLQQLQESVNP